MPKFDLGFADNFNPWQSPTSEFIQRFIFNPDRNHACVSGPVGTAKTYLILSTLHALCMMQKTRIAVARAEKATLYNSIIPTFRKVLRNGLRNCKEFQLVGGEKRPQEMHYYNGSEIIFTGADNDKMFSTEFDLIYLNELRLIKSEENYRDIGGRLRDGGYLSYGQKRKTLLISDTNPGGPAHWIKQRAERDEILLIPTTLKDNPQYFSDGNWTSEGEAYLQVLSETYGESGWQHDRYVLGNWSGAEGMVWPEFNWKEHVKPFTLEDIPSDWKPYGSVDYGIAKAACYQLWFVSPNRKRCWIFKEIYRTGLTEHRLAQEVKKLHAKYDLDQNVEIVGDPAGDGNQTFIDAKLMVKNAEKKILYGVDAARQYFKGVNGLELRINENSLSHDPDPVLIRSGKPKRTVEEIGDYTHLPEDKQITGTYKDDLPDKKRCEDHGCDALRYRLAEFIQPAPQYIDLHLEIPIPEPDSY